LFIVLIAFIWAGWNGKKRDKFVPFRRSFRKDFKELAEGRKPASFFNITYDPSEETVSRGLVGL
jgi:hypothetical protein